MGATRVIWHVGFERNLRRRGPRSIEVRSEFRLSDEPLRLDYLLLRKRIADGEVMDDSAETLRRLWPMLPKVTVVELRACSTISSASASPWRTWATATGGPAAAANSCSWSSSTSWAGRGG